MIRLRAVRLWLLTAAAMIFLTLDRRRRDTAYGIRPFDRRMEAGHGRFAAAVGSDWQSEFAKYQAIPQYRELNRGMSLDAFKMIYWWEWSHRLLARLTGAVFLLPFLFFLWRGGSSRSVAIAGCGRFSSPGRRSARLAGGWCLQGSRKA